MDATGSSNQPIALVGMSCKFAGDATSPEKLWDMLIEGRNAWSEIPSSRFNVKGHYHPRHENLSTTNVRGGHFLKEDIALFDAAFFNFSAETASTMDPQYRLQLESVYEALENAGITLADIAGSNTSVFAGAFFHDYHDAQMRDPDSLPRFLMTGNGATMASNRVSHFYDLLGPSMTLDTGCSTTLTALHQACQSLRAGDADMSLVGGSNVMINPDIFITMGSLGLLSPDGKSYTFDSRANGYGRGEGVATIVLKRLDDAIKAGDPIRAVIRETHLNQDGKTETITSPSQQAQEQLIRACYKKAGLEPNAVQYFEAHGTGTPTGDPIEVGAIASVFQEGRSTDDPLLIGSVKTNLGHTEPTSGLASVIKVALALERGVIPPSINFDKPNKRLSLDDWNLKVPTRCEDWNPGADGVRRASVNNFGYGGANAHVIMESWSPQSTQNGFHHVNGNGHTNGHTNGQPNGHTTANGTDNSHLISNGDGHRFELASKVFRLSAKDEQTCRAMAANLKEYLERLSLVDENNFLDNLAYTLGQRRTLFPWVVTYAAESIASLKKLLADTKSSPSRVSNQPTVGFVFTGQGAQWYAMGRELIDAYPVFKSSLLEADGFLREWGCEWSLLEELQRDAETSKINDVGLSTPLCIAVQISLVHLLKSWGVTPSAVGSHSSGEIAAAYTAGAVSYKSAMAISYCRGEITSVLSSGKGGMIAVGLGTEAVQPHLKRLKSGRANVACINSPSSVTVSGDVSAVEELEALLKQQNVFARRLKVGAAFHSHHMEPIAQSYLTQMKDVGVGKETRELGAIKFASPTTGTRMTDAAEIGSPEHWVKSMLSPVQFVDSFREMALDSDTGKPTIDLVIEVGPHAALSGPIRDILTLPELRDSQMSYHSCLVRNSNAVSTMQTLAGQLMCKGFPVDISAVNFPQRKPVLRVLYDLPPYPWNHQVVHWTEPRINKSRREREHAPHDLLGSLMDGTNVHAPTWRNIIRASELPWVRDHTVQSNIIYPGAGLVCMAIEAASQTCQIGEKTVSGYRLRDVDIQQALVIPDTQDGIEVQITLRPANSKAIGVKGWREFQISSATPENKWTEHCKGLIHVVFQDSGEDQGQKSSLDLMSKTKPLCGSSKDIDPEDIFSGMRSAGIFHGPMFRNLEAIQASEGQSVSTMSIADVQVKMPSQYQTQHVLHPTTLDSVFVSAYSALPESELAEGSPKVPKTIKDLWVSNKINSEAGHKFEVRSNIEHADSRGFRSGITLVDVGENGIASEEPLLAIDGFVCQSLGASIPRDPEPFKQDICSTLTWGPDISLNDPSFMKRELSSPVKEEDTKMLMDLRHACFHYMHDAIMSLQPSDIQQLEWYHVKFYNWMKLQDTLAQRGELGPGSSDWAKDSPQEKQKLFDAVTAASVNGELVCRLGPSIAAMLKHEVTPLELMMEGKLLYKYYQESLKFDQSNSQLSGLVKHFVHKNPQAKVLEIGGGTGGATRWVLNVIGNSISGTGPLASEYHFTDVSSGFFEAAKEEFSDWSDIMSYNKLDIEADPAKQGFEYGAYDLVIACQVLHATKNMETTMTNVRRLLKPGGKLMLFETTKDQVDMQFTFGLLPGWWLSEEPERDLSPTLSIPLWDRVLNSTGFTGVDLEVHDCESEEHYSFSVMMSTARPEETNGFHHSDPVALVCGNNQPEEEWLTTLQASIASKTGENVSVESLDSVNAKGKICVFLGEIETPLLPKPSPTEFEAIKALALNSKGLLWVTRGGAVDCDNPDLALSPGFLRSLRNEYSGKTYISLDLDPRKPSLDKASAQAVANVLATNFVGASSKDDAPRDFEFAERAGSILIPRVHKELARNRYISASAATKTEMPQPEPFEQLGRTLKLEIGTPGLLESLAFRDVLRATEDNFGPDLIEVEPKAFGLNFRDVMTAMGQLDEKRMGLECSGLITRVGDNAASAGYKVGDRVFCLLDGQYANRVRLPWTTAYHIPQGLSFVAAASVPMVYATAYISLYDTARLRKGQTVLIHAATGGVGQAAIVLSQLVGAEVFATAGTEEKRAFLVKKYGIPADHVFSSRDASFVPKIMSMTGTRGVDVVLNSLSAQLLQASFNCLAPFGHFVEIGKYDLEHNSYLEMVPFARAVSFTAIDLLALVMHRPSEIHRALASVARLMEQKAIDTVEPVTVFPLSEMEGAFRQMQAGKHMGKIVLSVGQEESVPVLPRKLRANLSPHSSYLIVGGVGGLGRSIARRMLSLGAKNLILMSRSASTQGKRLASELEETFPGSKVKLIGCDISDATSLSSALESCSVDLPPIRGVVQGAMVLKDSILEQMTIEDYRAAIGPKVQGTRNLHQQLGSELDFFIMLSSLAGVIGYTSQSNYTAGGAYQDALARHRVAKGLPAVAIDLGVVKAVGYVAAHKAVYERLTRIGHMTLSEEQVLSVIESAILHPSSQIMVGLNSGPGPQWDGKTGSPMARESRFSALRYRESKAKAGSSKAKAAGDNLAGKLASASSLEEAADLIGLELTKKLVDIFMIPIEEITASKPLATFGVDSLVAVELRNMLALQAGAEVSIFDIMQSPSLAALSTVVASSSAHVSV